MMFPPLTQLLQQMPESTEEGFKFDSDDGGEDEAGIPYSPDANSINNKSVVEKSSLLKELELYKLIKLEKQKAIELDNAIKALIKYIYLLVHPDTGEVK